MLLGQVEIYLEYKGFGEGEEFIIYEKNLFGDIRLKQWVLRFNKGYVLVFYWQQIVQYLVICFLSVCCDQ